MSTDILFVWAKALDIKIVFTELCSGLLGMADASKKLIMLDNSLKDKPRELKCVLAEEIGHILFPPRPGHIRYHSKSFLQREDCSMVKHIVAQDETKALDWATCVLLGNVDICRIKSIGAISLNELADHFDVEPWFMEHRIGYLRRKDVMPGR
ncbi:MAG: hypothetical protein PHY77_04225 [Desulfotomaculaceae bacterium]|nr:hypothetical protein [Desulfotomaculaceae bacterium]